MCGDVAEHAGYLLPTEPAAKQPNMNAPSKRRRATGLIQSSSYDRRAETAGAGTTVCMHVQFYLTASTTVDGYTARPAGENWN